MEEDEDLDHLLVDAAMNADAKEVRKLIKRGADADAVEYSTQYTALCLAVTSGDRPTVAALIKGGAHVDLPVGGRDGVNPHGGNPKYETPLSLATKMNFPKLVKLLKDSGAKF